MPIDLVTLLPRVDVNDATNNLVDEFVKLHFEVKINLEAANVKYKADADKHRHLQRFE